MKLHLLALGAAVNVHAKSQAELPGATVETLSDVLPCWTRGHRPGIRPSLPADVAHSFFEIKESALSVAQHES